MEKLVKKMKHNPANVKVSDLRRVCDYYFGVRRSKDLYHIYKTPWSSNPRINIQNDNGKGKAYQVRQVIEAIDILRGI